MIFLKSLLLMMAQKDTTRELIDSFRADYPVPLRHLWHEDEGYRRQRILNIAITKAAS